MNCSRRDLFHRLQFVIGGYSARRACFVKFPHPKRQTIASGTMGSRDYFSASTGTAANLNLGGQYRLHLTPYCAALSPFIALAPLACRSEYGSI